MIVLLVRGEKEGKQAACVASFSVVFRGFLFRGCAKYWDESKYCKYGGGGGGGGGEKRLY